MAYPYIELSEVCDFLDHLRVPVTENERKPGPYPYYGANGIQGRIDKYIFDEPLVLLAEDGGHFGSKTKPIAYKVEGKYWVNNHAHVLKPKEGYDLNFLHRVLSFYDVRPYINGSTREKLTKGNAEKILVPVPTLQEQKRIAAILDKADRLRRLRRHARQLTASLVNSAFFETFLSSKNNQVNYVPLKELCYSITDGVHKTPNYVASGIPFLTVQNLTSGPKISFQKTKFITSQDHKEFCKRTKPELGDILVSKDGTIGIAREIETTEEFSIFVSVALLKPKRDLIHPTFLNAQFNSPFIQEQIKNLIKGIAIRHLHLADFKELNIILPSKEIQEDFVEKIKKISMIQSQQLEAERQAEQLFQSLLHRAFTGQLSAQATNVLESVSC